jgi:uncharacterized protein (TIGR03083 family)
MSDVIEAIRADRDALVEISRGLSAQQWQAASGCAGWRVQDVVSHLATTFWAVVDGTQLPDVEGLPFEQAAEVMVQSRQQLTPEAALADYEQVSGAALQQVLPAMATLDMEIPMGDGGTYPAAMLANAYAFDHYVHIRQDLFGPRGPLDGPPPPSDEPRLAATLDWIEAALPQQNPGAADQATLEFVLTGPAARTIGFGSGAPKGTATSDVPTFVRYITQRGTWPELGVQASGDAPALAVARQLRVF